jgi:hypothetical protein
MDDIDYEWQDKGATLSDKSAQKEFGLSSEEIYAGIRAGKLRCREASMHGNPWLRLLRREVEALVKERHGGGYLKMQRAKTEVARIERELRRLKKRAADLEVRKAELLVEFTGQGSQRNLKSGGPK